MSLELDCLEEVCTSYVHDIKNSSVKAKQKFLILFYLEVNFIVLSWTKKYLQLKPIISSHARAEIGVLLVRAKKKNRLFFQNKTP